ncbi:hypothetical protein FHT32_001275 [Variovorax sp. SG517]|uniref:hypothetical protein n=1 Tax=Variovorax sp. SG517 TaxID=2587117 RepID=UPI00159DD0B8|nr:hypothetical protein [Variovorax sp. SG517]NVM87636.1 hypothetical protein [Variovorax sp. SG517]
MAVIQESKVVLNGQDNSGSAFQSLQQRFQGITSAADALKNRLVGGLGATSFGRLQTHLGNLRGQMAALGIAGGAGLAIGGIAAIKTGFDAVAETAEKAGRIHDLGGRLRLNAEEFQVFEKISKDAGASIEETGGAFLKFKLNIQSAVSEGGKKLQKLDGDLRAFGLTAAQAQQMKPLDLMKTMGLVSSKSTTEADEMLKIEKFRALAGKTGATLIPIFEAIGTDYDTLAKKMRASGTLMTDEMAAIGDSADEAYQRSKSAMNGLKLAFGVQMLPVFEQFSNIMEARMKANRSAMMPGVKALADVLSQNLKPFMDDMDRMADKTSGLFKILNRVAGLVGWDNLVFGGLIAIASPFILSAGGIALALGRMTISAVTAAGSFAAMNFAPALRSLVLFQIGLRSFGLSAAASWALALAPVTLVVAAVGAVAALGYLIYQKWDGIKAFFVGVWDGFMRGIAPVADALAPLSGIASVVGSAFSVMGSLIGGAIDWVMQLFAPVDKTKESFAAWGLAGQSAGDMIATTFKMLLTPITAVIDAVKLFGSVMDWAMGKEFKFDSSTAKLFQEQQAQTAEVQRLQTVLPVQTAAAASAAIDASPGPAGASSSSSSSISRFGAGAPSISIPTPKVDVSGRLDVRVTAEGKPEITRVESRNPNFNIDARSGGMFSTP